MTEKEHEFKMILNEDEHHFLLRFFCKLMVESGLQTNYYYDTQDEVIRKRNTTVRVRLKNGRLIGVVKRLPDTVDYEFEIEYSKPLRKWAEGILMLIGSIMHLDTMSKTERFFQKVN